MAVLQKSLEDMTVFLVDKVDEKGLCYNEHQREELANQDRQLKKERTN